MKTKELIFEMYKACINHDTKKEKELWFKAMKKSLKHKKTFAIR